MARLLASLINKPEKWTQDCLARDRDGNAVPSFDVLHELDIWNDDPGEVRFIVTDYSRGARSFSLYGAIAHCYDSDRREQVCDKVRRAITAVTGRAESIASFNNRPETTFKEIKDVMLLANV